MEAILDTEPICGRAFYHANKGVAPLAPGAVTMYYQLDLLGEAAIERVWTDCSGLSQSLCKYWRRVRDSAKNIRV